MVWHHVVQYMCSELLNPKLCFPFAPQGGTVGSQTDRYRFSAISSSTILILFADVQLAFHLT